MGGVDALTGTFSPPVPECGREQPRAPVLLPRDRAAWGRHTWPSIASCSSAPAVTTMSRSSATTTSTGRLWAGRGHDLRQPDDVASGRPRGRAVRDRVRAHRAGEMAVVLLLLRGERAASRHAVGVSAARAVPRHGGRGHSLPRLRGDVHQPGHAGTRRCKPFHTDARIGVVPHVFAEDALRRSARSAELDSATFDERRLLLDG